ncbi:hypothetical protein BVRB_025100, partial [Beta vulgaris subsp. vulgaris]
AFKWRCCSKWCIQPASHSEEVKQDEEKENIGNMPVSDRSRRAKRRERLRNAQSAAQQIVTVVLDADAVTHPTPPKKQKKKRKPTHPAANGNNTPVLVTLFDWFFHFCGLSCWQISHLVIFLFLDIDTGYVRSFRRSCR